VEAYRGDEGAERAKGGGQRSHASEALGEPQLKSLFRGVVVVVCLALLVCFAKGQEPPPQLATTGYQISGTVKNGKTTLPGVTLTAANTLTGKKFTVASAVDGSFTLKNLPRGRYVVKIEFMGFASQTAEVVLNPENPSGKVEADLVLASRQQEQTARANSATAASRGFQSLAVDDSLAGLTASGLGNGGGGGAVSANDLASLPMNGAGTEVSTESVSVSGAQGRTQDFGSGNDEELQQRMQEFRDRMQREGGTGGFGGLGGGPGGAGPGGPVMIGRMGRGFDINKPHGFLYFQDDNSGLDARSYSLTGGDSQKASYNQIRFGMMVGGPLKIPKIFDGGKTTFYTFGWNGTRGSTPYDAFSTVPTALERIGDFSGLTDKNGNAILIYDPQTGQPFAGNRIDPPRISSSAKSLLNYIPLPNLPTATQNFHYITSAASDTDSLSTRLIHNFSGSGPGFGPPGGGGGGGGGRGGRGPRNNINIGFNWSRSTSELENPFPSLAGSAATQGWNASIRWVYGKGRTTNNLGFTYNHNRISTTNLFSGVTDVAGNAGITGISSDPFDWGLPGTSFNNFAGFNGPTPSRELDQTYAISDGVIWNRGKHNVRFGGDFRWILQNFRSARNAEGSFVFTGFATAQYLPGSTQQVPNTGYDLADFLLGLPQQTSLQSGTSSYAFRSNYFDGYVQDDWRLLPNFSVNLGLRYEYSGPFTEAQNHIADLDVAPGYTASALVLPGETGPYSGYFPLSLVRADRNNFAPRIGLAWKLGKGTVVRAGYGLNYNLAQYGVFIRNFAFQPPFAVTATNISSAASPLTLQDGFPPAPPGTLTNNFAVEPSYVLPYVQVWNLDIQRQLPWGVQLNAGYNGAEGVRLDTQRALVTGGQPFIYETSEGDSSLNAGSVRVRKRMAKGLGISVSYVFSKSIDDAASIGGGGVVVAQNPYDISADRGLSSFDQKHKFTGNWMYDLPFGDGRRFFTRGAMSHVLGGFQWSGDFTIASGFYFTPRVLGASLDISRGVSGSLRANILPGAAISVSNPTTAEWFNTAAFCAPGPGCQNPADSQYGNAGRNIIEGPSQFTFNMALSKTITIRESRALELRLQGTNIFNTPYFSGLNTVVNSLTFGQITGTANMRRVTMLARFRF
jgi:trimeric autotransporter adhesin